MSVHPLDDGSDIKDADGNSITNAAERYAFHEYVASERLRLLRKERDRLLAETDHWAYQDTATMTQAQIDYRQSLRDITDSYANVDDAVWPTKP